MSDIRIEVFSGDYSNSDAYNRVLGYIGQKAFVFGYGFSLDPNHTIIEQFQQSETYSFYQNPQKIWHFILTFSRRWRLDNLLNLGELISSYFKNDYQVLCGLDTLGQNPHLHFGVNAFSYNPSIPVLDHNRMKACMAHIQKELSLLYYLETITLQFQGKVK